MSPNDFAKLIKNYGLDEAIKIRAAYESTSSQSVEGEPTAHKPSGRPATFDAGQIYALCNEKTEWGQQKHTQAQVAAIVGCSLGNVQRILRNARKDRAEVAAIQAGE